MDRKRWDIVIPTIVVFLLIIVIIIALVRDVKEEVTENKQATATVSEPDVATASEATPAEAKEEPEPTIEVVHCKTTETTTQEETSEEITTEVFSATVTEITTEDYTENTTEEWTEEITEEPATEYVEEVYEEPAPPEEPQEPEAPSEPEGMTYLGTYTITGYTWTGDPCANGNYPTVGYTVACNSLEIGTVIYIEGIGTRVVEDRVGRSGKIVDVFVDSTATAYSITGSYEVYIVE